MRRPIKPFAVETRRGGRRISGAKFDTVEDEQAPKPAPEWPPLREEEDETYAAALRAADALFSRPAPEAAAAAVAEEGPAQRRILPNLTEEDHISRLLAEQEAQRPRRGRRPREAGETEATAPQPQAIEAPAPELAAAPAGQDAPGSGVIRGYVRGRIYSLYARHDSTRPGEQWRKRDVRPRW